MNRLPKLVSWGILGMALNGIAATSATGGRVGLALRRPDPQRLDPGGRRREEQVGGRRRGHRGHRPGVDALQPEGRIQELQVPGRGQDQRPRQLGHVLPLPEAQRQLLGRVTRPRSTAPTATRSGPARSTGSSTSTSRSSRPTPGSPTRSRSWTRTGAARRCRTSRCHQRRGPVRADRVHQGLGIWPFRLPAARPGQQGPDPQDRGHGAGREREVTGPGDRSLDPGWRGPRDIPDPSAVERSDRGRRATRLSNWSGERRRVHANSLIRSTR